MQTKTQYIRFTTESLRQHIEKRRGIMTKVDFAAALDTTRVSVDAWERGTNVPTPAMLEKLGLRPALEVLDDSPLEAAQPSAAKSREEILEEENRKLRKALRAVKKPVKSEKGMRKK